MGNHLSSGRLYQGENSIGNSSDWVELELGEGLTGAVLFKDDGNGQGKIMGGIKAIKEDVNLSNHPVLFTLPKGYEITKIRPYFYGSYPNEHYPFENEIFFVPQLSYSNSLILSYNDNQVQPSTKYRWDDKIITTTSFLVLCPIVSSNEYVSVYDYYAEVFFNKE